MAIIKKRKEEQKVFARMWTNWNLFALFVKMKNKETTLVNSKEVP